MSYLFPPSTRYDASPMGSRGIEPMPDPFMDYASMAMPDTLEDVLRWCERIMLANGVYRAAIDRVISYFITDIEIGDADRDVKDMYTEFLNDTLGIKTLLRQIALDYVTYGNSFISLVVPFRRNLSCPKCGFEAPLKQVYNNHTFGFQWNFDFRAKCPMCHYDGKWTHIDRRTAEEDSLIVKRWSPHEIELLWDPYTDQVNHIWKIPQYYRQQITRGHLFHLERAPWEIIKAIQHNNYVRFDDGIVYHAKEDTLAGVLNKGWGISRVLTNFRQAWYVQVLHRYNEAIGLDYIIPFRVITPEPRPGGANGEMSDPLFTMDLGGFTGQVNTMLRRRRRDPATWHTLPFPIRYQSLGAEASQLAPYQLMDQAVDELLNAVGVPVDFYKGSLAINVAPAALRLLESNWNHLTHVLNKALQWLVSRVSTVLSWDEVTCRLARPSHADDLNRQLAKLQLMMGRQISQTTGLKSVGLEFEDEQKRMLDEEKYVAEESAKTQEELEAAGMGDLMASGQLGPMPGGGVPGGTAPQAGMGQMPATPAQPAAPAQGAAPVDPMAAGGAGAPMDPVSAVLAQLPQGPNQSMTPQEMLEIATTIARQLFSMPEGQKDSALRKIKQTHPHIHQLIKSQLESMRQQAGNQGVAMAQQAAQAQGVTGAV